LLEKIYTEIANDYSNSVSLINASNKWFFVKNLPDKKENILDVGCGAGDLLLSISKYFKKSYGIDPVPDFVLIAKKKNPNSKILKSSAEKLPFPDNYFDYVVSNLVFQHTEREKAIKEVIRVLKPGGKLVLTEVISQPNEWYLQIYAYLYRRFWTYPNLFLAKGYSNTQRALKFLKSSEWKKLTSIHAPRRFTLNKFKEFYSKYLPEAKFRYLDLRIESVVWTKPKF
jgi:ubiquinone/menaquinone biosynthesis C-methylase UbiE